ncbi:EF-hand calcium binding domain 2, isoform CRA_b [Mus musculus]|nr:EF-hand calcium binding domain 2, isoform CRA_b [Mus musculus]
MAEERDAEGTEALIAELHKKIKDAFEVFDHESNNTVDRDWDNYQVIRMLPD